MLRRGLLVCAAVPVGAAGLGFLLFAAFAGLRAVLGPEFAALVLGAGLLLASAGLLYAAGARGSGRPRADQRRDEARPVAPDPSDAATMAAFTAAFVAGRVLADRKRG